MRMAAKAIAVLGFLGAAAVGVAGPASAQGVYFEGPGVEFGVGVPWYHHRYYRYYDDGYGYRFHRHYHYWHGDWD